MVENDECEYYGQSFSMLHGDMDRLLPMRLLEGPSTRRNELTEYRLNKHDDWVKAVSVIQSRVNRGYQVPSSWKTSTRTSLTAGSPTTFQTRRSPFRNARDEREGATGDGVNVVRYAVDR